MSRDCGHDAPTIYPGAMLIGFGMAMTASEATIRAEGERFQQMDDAVRERMYGPGECATCWARRVGDLFRASTHTAQEAIDGFKRLHELMRAAE